LHSNKYCCHFDALMLLVRRQKGHLPCEKVSTIRLFNFFNVDHEKNSYAENRSVVMYQYHQLSWDMFRSTHSITVCTSLLTYGGARIYSGQLTCLSHR